MNIHSNITFIIFTYNEEKRIEYPIKCFLPYGDVLISDDSSTDKTTEIARKLGAKVIKRKTHIGFVENKEEVDFVFKHIKTDWVFWGFADNMIPKSCLELYAKISNETQYKIVFQKIKTLLYSKNNDPFPYLNLATRFFRKESIDFSENQVHQMGKIVPSVKQSEVLYLPPLDEYSIYHFSTHTTEVLLDKINYYTNFQAKNTPPKSLFLKTFLSPIFHFVTFYFLSGGFLRGYRGFFLSAQYSLAPFFLYPKIYEFQHNLTVETVEKDFAIEKRRLLHKSPKSTTKDKIIAKIVIFLLSRLHIFVKVKNSA